MILLATEGWQNKDIAVEVALDRRQVALWRQRFLQGRGLGLHSTRVQATLDSFDGKFIMQGGKVEVLEGGWPESVILLSFPRRDPNLVQSRLHIKRSCACAPLTWSVTSSWWTASVRTTRRTSMHSRYGTGSRREPSRAEPKPDLSRIWHGCLSVRLFPKLVREINV
jgi:hypothetical protein